ncbi:hypothetical protein PVAND_016059 [Polypedilum vanderplanki]|uniref:Peptidase S1 domain-containing protein n=1 Tax=Polypedilum vanderplanki TaxID=319348 RepID=A0A9J6BE01_POLVA|nr:hypothetical protein PVAND_016059 [Polypedilum vanderplanki]
MEGKNAELGQFPHMADLSVEHYGKFYHLCGATIIHSRWIITAGHCAYYGVKNNIPINVTLGVVDITNGPHQWSVIVPPKDIIIHENYSDDGETAWNDIALLRIRKTVFFNEKILPIKLPSKDDPNDFSNEIGYLSGFGFNLNRNKSEPNILQYITEKF